MSNSLYERELEQFFDTAIVQDSDITCAVSGKYVAISESRFAGVFNLPTDGLTDLSEVPNHLVMQARTVFARLGRPAVTLGKAKTFPPLKILSKKTVNTYVATNKTIDACGDAEEPAVAEVAIIKKKAVSKKRPAVAYDASAVKKKRTKSGKDARIKEAEDKIQEQHLIIEALVEEKASLLQTIQGLQEDNDAPAPFDDEWEEESEEYPEEEGFEDIPVGARLRPDSQGIWHFKVGGGRSPQSGPRMESGLLRQSALEDLTNLPRTESPRQGDRNKSDHTINGGGAAVRRRVEEGRRPTCVTLNGSGIKLAMGPQPLRLRNHNFGLAHRIMVKRLATSPHDPLGVTDSSCKNQLVMVSVQYGPFNTYIPIRSTTIGKSRVSRDPIAMHTSWRSNSDIASVTRQTHLPKTHPLLWPEIYHTIISSDSIGYPRIKVSGESSTMKHRLLHASRPHPIPSPNDPK
ncbi:hypothetical protein F511_29560 [Dorcoceras hygrometricum]|uniref:Uncharacterized protein n=1 Tax=Dorcoceras hygrometricum TaxID=472368 RepID=A0A2Z7D815_9LAMI|nr:hypothetical protein F511_29560 [Dorcoceras hygrometricum]